MGEMTFNGISTADKGVVIQTPPAYEFPEKDYEVYHIEGRNGDLTIDKGSYKNVKRTYYLAPIVGAGSTFVKTAQEVVKWLMGAKGYARLEDSYEPLYYRKALYRQGGGMADILGLGEATRINVSFECKPQRYLKTGETPEIVSTENEWVELNENPTLEIALPEITVEGTSGMTIEFGVGPDNLNVEVKSSLVINFTDEGILDSELQDCYNNTEFLNSQLTLTNGFPKMYPGKNWIKITNGTITKLEIKHNWWTL